MSEDNKTPILDLSVLDEINNTRPEINDYSSEDSTIFEEKDKEFKELEELHNQTNDVRIKEAADKLKNITIDNKELNNLLEQIQNKMTYAKSIIEYRVNKTLMMLSNAFDKDQIQTDIAIIKYFQDQDLDFSHMHFHLNYDPTKKEEYFNFSELLDQYIDEVKKHKWNTNKILESENEFDPLYELRSIKFQEYMKNEVEEMLQEEKGRIEKEDSKTK